MNDKRTPVGPFGPSARSDVSPFVAMDVLALANERQAAGERVIHMEVGQPMAPLPRGAREAVRRGLADDDLRYTDALGASALRQRIAEHYREAYGLDIDPARVAVTVGSSGAFTLIFLAAFNPGARVAIASPGYPAYPNTLRALGLEPVFIELSSVGTPNIGPEQLEALHAESPLAGVIVASPANPTGSMLSPGELVELVKAAEALGIRFISDEIYHGLTYQWDAATAASASSKAIVVNSFSKYYCMAGWRVGWTVLPEDLVRPVERLAQNLFLSPPDLSQRAALRVMDDTEELEATKRGYAKSRRLLLDRLAPLGFEDAYPVDGAFYYYASIRRFSNDSMEFARQMLQATGVAATPGLDFDRARGQGTIRFSFAGDPTEIAEAVERLEGWLG